MNHLKTFFTNSTKAGRITNGIYILLRIIVVIMLVIRFGTNIGEIRCFYY